MLRVTQAPQGPVQVKQQFTLVGIASPSYAGRNLNLTVDNQFNATGPQVGMDGSWRLNFLFQQTGDRRLKLAIDNESVEITIQVVTALPPAPPRLQFTEFPRQAVPGQSVLLVGVANGYEDGAQLLLRVDQKYELARPVVQSGRWQALSIFSQAGDRLIEIVGTGQDKAQISLKVIEAPAPIPRLRFTQAPKTVNVGQTITLAGEAEGYTDGTQLLLRVDQKFELARPPVQAGKWQIPISFNQAGKRLVEIIGSEQEKAQITIDVLEAAPRPPRLSFTNPPAQVRAEQQFTLSGGALEYKDGDQLLLRADQKFELGKPRVQAGKWEAPILFHQAGRRLIEIIGSEQDRAQIILEVQALPASQLQILARSTWTTSPTPSELPNLTPGRITIHHTALPGFLAANATQAQDAARMRTLWSSHVNGRGYSDIGYHYIIMPSGRVFEARSERKRGAHDVINDGLGIAFDGIYTDVTINQRQFQVAVALCTLLCRRHGITDTVTAVPTLVLDTATDDYVTRNLPRICAHRDRVATACPGSEGGRTVRLPEIRQAVNTALKPR